MDVPEKIRIDIIITYSKMEECTFLATIYVHSLFFEDFCRLPFIDQSWNKWFHSLEKRDYFSTMVDARRWANSEIEALKRMCLKWREECYAGTGIIQEMRSFEF